ncbi:MAG: EVE domain-containing protein [Saprospiraceae bacterium]
MAFWLIKSEPFVYSFQRLQEEGRVMWDGVRNYMARNYLRAMQTGDLVLFYHSREGLEVVGLCEVVREYYPDPTATDGDWSVVDFAPVRALNKPVPLALIKATPELQQIGLVRMGRLSVMPLTDEAFNKILELSQ